MSDFNIQSWGLLLILRRILGHVLPSLDQLRLFELQLVFKLYSRQAVRTVFPLRFEIRRNTTYITNLSPYRSTLLGV